MSVRANFTRTESPGSMVPANGFDVMQVKVSGTERVAVKAPVLTNWRATPFASVTATGLPPLTVTWRPETPFSPPSLIWLLFRSSNAVLTT